MSDVLRLHPITRIRGELSPAPSVERAVNRFLDRPVQPGTMRMYTTAQAVIEQGEQHGRHAAELARIEKEFQARSVAKRVFVLAPPLKLQEGRGGSGRLFFNVRENQQPDLEYVGRRLGVIEGLEEPDDEDMLCVEFSLGALAKDLARRREQIIEGRDKINAELRHPTARFRMTASGLHVVTRDMIYPLKEPSSGLPDIE